MALVLIVEDEPILGRNLRDALVLSGHEVIIAATGGEGIAQALAIRPSLVLTDYRLPDLDGLEVLRRIKAQAEHPTAFIMMTAHGEVAVAVQAMKSGASDFLLKPLDLQELRSTVDRVLRQQSASDELRYFRERERAHSAIDDILGNSPAVCDLRDWLRRIVKTPALATPEPPCVLITGETGTGKDLIARAIHYAGPRRDAQFVHINCTAIGETLAESEFFGHVKGAFTDARSDKRGLFEVADQGTLFLDEIGHMSPTLQAKLLSTIERRTIRPVGGSAERRVNVHVIAATNRKMEEAIEIGEFREDLYHRLRVLTAFLPPLRERGNDIEMLARHFLHQQRERFGVPVEDFSPAAVAALRAYDWPGNVRELLHTIERSVLFADSRVVDAEHLGLPIVKRPSQVAVELPGGRSIRIEFSDDGPKLEDIENEIIAAALHHASHNLSRASRWLGISRDAIRYRLDRYQKKDRS